MAATKSLGSSIQLWHSGQLAKEQIRNWPWRELPRTLFGNYLIWISVMWQFYSKLRFLYCRQLLLLLWKKALFNLAHSTRWKLSSVAYLCVPSPVLNFFFPFFLQSAEDINLVINIQRIFSYLPSIPGFFSIQRPFLPLLTGTKRSLEEESGNLETSPIKSLNLGWNGPQSDIPGAPPAWPIPSLLPGVSCELGPLLSKMPSATPLYNPNTDNNLYGEVHVVDVRVEPQCRLDEIKGNQEPTKKVP